MKTSRLYLYTVMGFTATTALVTHAEKVSFEQLPSNIQQAIRSEAGSSRIEDIDREIRNGKTIYEAAFKRDGLTTEIVVDDQGRMLSPDGSLKIASGKVGFNELPQVIQNSIKVRAGQAQIEDIDREVRNGEVVYQVAFKENGLNRDVRIDSGGRILSDVAAPLSTPGRIGNEVLLVSTTPVPFNDVPWQVQHAIQSKAGLSYNSPVQVGTWNAQKVYQVSLPEGGSTKVFQFTEGGKDVATIATSPTLVNPVASGGPAPADTGSVTSRPAYSARGVVPLSNTSTVGFKDVPWRAQHGFQKQLGQNFTGRIQKGQWNGQTIYQTIAQVNGQPMTLQFNENGQSPTAVATGNAAPVIGATGSTPANRNTGVVGRTTPYRLSGGSKLTLEQAPEAVRNALKQETRGAAVEDLERGNAEGMTVYEAAFKSGGGTIELQIGENGQVLYDPRNPGRNLKPATMTTAATLSNSQKLDPADAPYAVKAALNEKLGNNRLEDLERGTFQGKNVYEAAFKDNGKHVEIQIAEDGSVLFDPRDRATGAAGTTATGAATSKYANVKSAVTLGSGSKVSVEQAPEPVRRAIQTHSAGARIEDLERGTWNGQTVYEAAFKANGKHVELQLDEKGEVIFDPRTTSK